MANDIETAVGRINTGRLATILVSIESYEKRNLDRPQNHPERSYTEAIHRHILISKCEQDFLRITFPPMDRTHEIQLCHVHLVAFLTDRGTRTTGPVVLSTGQVIRRAIASAGTAGLELDSVDVAVGVPSLAAGHVAGAQA